MRFIVEKHNEDTLADSMLSLRKRENTYLDKIDKIIDWGIIKRILDKKYKWTKNASMYITFLYSPALY